VPVPQTARPSADGEPGKQVAGQYDWWVSGVKAVVIMSPYHPGMAQTTIWTGDPVWIADVLAAQGVKLVEYPGRRNRGHDNFKDIRGVMVHHTGSRRDRHGHPAR